MAKDQPIFDLQTRLDDLLETVEAYRADLEAERQAAITGQPTNQVYQRRIGGLLGYLDELETALDGDIRDIIIRAADLSFTKNQARDPHHV